MDKTTYLERMLFNYIFEYELHKICSGDDITEILLELALNTNQSINQSINQSTRAHTRQETSFVV
jgi:hypothetical protein